MKYIRLSNGEYPVTREQIAQEVYPMILPGSLEADHLATLGFGSVQEVEPPHEDGHQAVELAPLLQGNQWVQQWELVPVELGPDPVPRIITEYAFRQRFSGAEKIAIYTAAKSSVELEVWLDDLRAADYVDLDHPPVVAGVEAVEAAGLIAPGRADEVLGRTAAP